MAKDANDNCRDPQLRTCLAEHSEPQRHSRQRDAQFNAWEFDSHQVPSCRPNAMTIGKTIGSTHIARRAKLRTHIPTATIARMWSESGDWMLEALAKPIASPPRLWAKAMKRVEEKEENYQRAAGRSCAFTEVFHGVIPKSIAARWIVQNAPSDPTVYPGSA